MKASGPMNMPCNHPWLYMNNKHEVRAEPLQIQILDVLELGGIQSMNEKVGLGPRVVEDSFKLFLKIENKIREMIFLATPNSRYYLDI